MVQLAIVLPGRKSALRAGFWQHAIGNALQSGIRPAEGRPEARFQCRSQAGQNLARKADLQPGSMPPGRQSAFRIEIGPPAGRRPDFGAFQVAGCPKYGPQSRFTARKHSFAPGLYN